MRLPPRAIDLARQELQRWLAVPESDVGARQRARLQSRLARLGQLYSWGDMTEGDHRREVQATRDLTAVSPDESKVVAFDRLWRVIDSMPGNIEWATPVQRKELVRLLVERVESQDGRIVPDSVVWSGPARPFFDSVVGAPPDGLGDSSTTEPLAWYVAV